MSLIILPGINAGESKARICYQNVMEQGVVTATNADSANPVKNCFDWNTADWFKSAVAGGSTIDVTLDDAVTVDYLAFYNQNLFSLGGTIKLQYNDGSGFVDASPVIAPTDNAPRMVFFDAKLSTQWRIIISCESVFSLGVLAFGKYLGLPRGMYIGWSPPKHSKVTRLTTSISEGGNFLGRSRVSTGILTSLNLNNAPDAWVDANWPSFVDHAETKPFFFAPNVQRRPDDCTLCWINADTIPAPVQVHYGYMSASLPIRGVIE